jgi:hypothetical protein
VAEFGNADSLRHSIGNTVLLDADVNNIRHVAGQRQVQHRLGEQKDKYENNCPNERLEMFKKFCHLRKSLQINDEKSGVN